MLSTKSLFAEIRHNPDAYQLFLSIAAKGETQGGWENERISVLTKDSELAAKIRRHGADETKHGLMFAKLLRKVDLDTVPVPLEADYCLTLEQRGIGLSHQRLEQDRPLDEKELLKYLVHSKITEERAAAEVRRLLAVFEDDPEIAPTLRIIDEDEINHLAYTHEELLRLSDNGFSGLINNMLKTYASAEISTYRDISLEFVDRMDAILGWGGLKKSLLKFGIHFVYHYERIWGWRKLVALRQPTRRNAMGSTVSQAALTD